MKKRTKKIFFFSNGIIQWMKKGLFSINCFLMLLLTGKERERERENSCTFFVVARPIVRIEFVNGVRFVDKTLADSVDSIESVSINKCRRDCGKRLRRDCRDCFHLKSFVNIDFNCFEWRSRLSLPRVAQTKFVQYWECTRNCFSKQQFLNTNDQARGFWMQNEAQRLQNGKSWWKELVQLEELAQLEE